MTDEQLNVIQRKIDRFLVKVTYPVYKIKKLNVDCIDVRKEFEFLSIQQRRDYVVLRDVYSDIKDSVKELSKQSILSKIPRLKIPKFKSECYRKSLDYRGAILWNKLPNDLKVGELSKEKFRTLLYENLLQS